MLILANLINYLDRQIIGILVPQIKTEFDLPDWQIGLLTGPAFALVYALVGIPMAMIADRINRRNLITAAVALFGVTTVLCGYCVQYLQLIIMRFGTGLGEGGVTPTANSVIADLYPPQRRGVAIAQYNIGGSVGIMLSFLGGGWIAQHYGWRSAFVAAGVPGLALALLMALSMREPQRGLVDQVADDGDTPTTAAVVRKLWGQRSFRWMALGGAMTAFGGSTLLGFVSLFLASAHHMESSRVGLYLAVMIGVGGSAGTYAVGLLADRFGCKDVRAYLIVPAVSTLISVPFMPVFFLATNTSVTLLGGFVYFSFVSAYLAPAFAITHRLVPLRMRARAIAILLLITNLVGFGLGPPLTGAISDVLRPAFGGESLRMALLLTILATALSPLFFWNATKTLKADILRATGEPAAKPARGALLPDRP